MSEQHVNMLCARVEKQSGERFRRKLIELGLLNFEHIVGKNANYLWFPLLRKPNKNELEELKKVCEFKLEERELEKVKRKPRSMKEALEKLLSKEELEKLVTSFDTIGDIAVIEIPNELLAKKHLIGKAILQANPQIKTVARVLGRHEGAFRIRPIEIIAGKQKTVTLHKEHGCVFKVDVAKVYFSPRLSFERMRIAKQIKENELIGAWFAGVGPFPIVFAKHSKMQKAIAIELNPEAYKLLVENIKLNKCEEKVQAVLGDVKKVVPEMAERGFRYDRIVMPMPKGSELFLHEAFIAAKKHCIVHFYRFAPIENPFEEALEAIKREAEKHRRKVQFLEKRIVRQVSATKVQIVIDFEIQ